MPEYFEVRLSGSGGQGMMLAGTFLAKAAGIYDHKNIVLCKSYGPEARGGACRSEVIISEEPIVYPEVQEPDLVLAMTQEACDKYYNDLKPGGIMIIDPEHVQELPDANIKIFKVPLTQIAREEIGNEITANVVALGAFTAIVDWVARDSIRKAILDQTPKGTDVLNKKAFDCGYTYVINNYEEKAREKLENHTPGLMRRELEIGLGKDIEALSTERGI